LPAGPLPVPGEASGEVVFNTSMTGYQEVLTDPSYSGQMVTMTYPLVGNYGVNDEDVESARIQVAAFLVKEYQPFPSNFRSTQSLADYLAGQNVSGRRRTGYPGPDPSHPQRRGHARHPLHHGPGSRIPDTACQCHSQHGGHGPGPEGHHRAAIPLDRWQARAAGR
jgi:hypothetical protein